MILLLSLYLLLLCHFNLFSIGDKFGIKSQGFILGFTSLLLAVFPMSPNEQRLHFLRALEGEDKLTEELCKKIIFSFCVRK